MVLRRVAGAHRVGQLAGILRFLVSIGEYYSKMDEQLFAKFPAAMWGEAVVVIQIAGGIILARKLHQQKALVAAGAAPAPVPASQKLFSLPNGNGHSKGNGSKSFSNRPNGKTPKFGGP